MTLVFIYAFVWSVGGSLDVNSAQKFNTYLNQHFEPFRPPNNAQFVDVFVDFDTRAWRLWEDIVPAFVYNPLTPYFELLV